MKLIDKKLAFCLFCVAAFIVLMIVSTFFAGCSTSFLTKKGATSMAVIVEMHSYEIRLMKLPSGSIPTNSIKIPIADTTNIHFTWTQKFETTPYDEQPNPTDYGQSTNYTIYTFANDDVIWETPEEAQSIAGVINHFVSLSEGEYQVQICGSVWDSVNLQGLWSKWSDAVGFYAYIPDEPPARATNVMISLD